jgi:ribosomal protein S18 acetylase RimI-like enzyme
MAHLILPDARDDALIRAIHANLYAYFAALQNAAQTEMFRDARVMRWHTPIPHPWFNGVVAYTAPDEQAMQWVGDTIAFFRDRNIPIFTWWLDPDVVMSAWDDILRAHGFQFDHGEPGMAVVLDALAENFGAPPALEIARVNDLEMLRVLAQTFLVGYSIPETLFDALFQVLIGFGVQLPTRFYLARLGAQWVGTAMLWLAAGVAGIYNVSTLPAARRQGIGSALTYAALADARALGYRVGVLQSSEMGYRMYLRLGFRHVCDMAHYYWRAR